MRPGTRLASVTCTTEVVVVRVKDAGVDLTCGGHPMVEMGAATDRSEPKDGLASGTALGKRYVDEAETIEVLCTKAGEGTLAVGGIALRPKVAKPLPASD